MIESSIARRYARALFESVGAEFARVGSELESVARSFKDQPELTAFLSDPSASRESRRTFLDAVISKTGLHPMAGNLLRLLDDRGRLLDLPAIAAAYSGMVDEHEGRVRAEVTTVDGLGSELAEQLKKALSSATGKQVELSTHSDPGILGGMIARVGNTVFDGSLRSQLERMKRELVGQP
ncbi:ATP synthase F1 subunit delta [Vulgatibacter incomptus]|uniref:ATP synthase subunit delta n=1 Tax=Vulgatibacter incomptus TaxID=1391653 RepID=A0A0K1PH66_9BACT|nr:ATP synthase F1 subunit delta [Vulgatibacter incomptus]AKU92865.1 ATP synthase delta chain [Vulgatibacter incomptus]